MDTWTSRIVGEGDEPPDQLLANPRNWRVHPKAQQQALTAVLDEVGWVQRVIVNRTTGHVVDGHLRVSLALSRGEPHVPVAYVELTADEEALVLASLDPLAGMAGTDEELLRDLVSDLAVTDAALAELLGLAEGTGGPLPEVPVEMPEGEPRTKPGDLWVMGDHRLLSGDATDPLAVGRLLDADPQRVGIVWTDPPYGVDYTGKTEEALKIDNDALGEHGEAELLRRAFRLGLDACRPGAAWYVTAPARPLLDVFATVLRELGLRRHTLVWVKDQFVLGHSDYHYRHETLFYGWVPGGPRVEPPDRTQDSVWEIPRPKASRDHPTTKPVELVARALRNSSDPGDLVYDPFAGSGTTALAAEATGRRARLMELDPRYCDVSVHRWEEATGEVAKLDG